MAVEDYEDTADAVIHPLLFTGGAWMMAYTTGHLVSAGGLLATGSAAIIGLFGLAFTALAPVSAVASYQYITERATGRPCGGERLMSAVNDGGGRVTADPQSEPLTFGLQAITAVFIGSPEEQVIYSFVAAVFAYVSSLFTFGATAVLIVIFSITLLVGLARLAYASLTG
jgi:hypothetical protein